ncbi:MAG: haloacid dehalogenase [Chloroflexi bacterium]|nr:haloacid dehalogenase [Chloroflexota bacterium]
MQTLDPIGEKIRHSFEAKNAARDAALAASRELIRHCALSIRATHRAEHADAAQLLGRAKDIATQMKANVAAYPDLYFAGYVQDALKEFAEANIVASLITGGTIPDPDALGIEYAAYLNGLGEAAGELRRYALDIIRHDTSERVEKVLDAMEDIYSLLVTMDFPDALTGGLRRTTDMVRGVLERTRGDLTIAARQEKLEARLREFEERLGGK